jgi:hypothetical protein
LKSNSHDINLQAVHLKALRSRIDEGLTSLDHGEGTDGEKFMRGMLGFAQGKNARCMLPRKATYDVILQRAGEL